VSAGSAPAGRFTPLAWGAFAGCTLIWGCTWFVIRTQIAQDVPASWSVTWRFVLGAAAMFALCVVRGRPLRLTARQHGFAAVLALCQFVLNFNLVYAAEHYLASGLVSLTFAFLLVANAVFAALFLGQRVTRRFLIGSAIGLSGVALLFAPDLARPGGDGMATGLALAFGGVLAASLGNVMQGSAMGRAMPLEAGLAWAMAWGAAADAAVALVLDGPPRFSLAPAYLAGLAYLGVVASAVAFSLYYTLIRIVGPGQAAWNGVVVPVVAMLLSTWAEDFLWTPAAMLGVVLALSGLAYARRSA
jgi:drug/metabolite transporter (DMT)-like permease